jgi:hypothetical protein
MFYSFCVIAFSQGYLLARVTCLCLFLFDNFTLLLAAYLSTGWCLTAAAASLDLPRWLETCAGERLVENVISYSPDLLGC